MSTQIVEDGANNYISAVTVFSQQAFVTRHVKVDVSGGNQIIQIISGARSIDLNSVQARVFGQGEIVAVQLQEIAVPLAFLDEENELNARIDDLLDQKNLLSGRSKSVEQQQRLLDSMAGFTSVQLPREIQTSIPDLDSLQSLMEYLNTNASRLQDQAQSLRQEERQLEKELKRVSDRLHELKDNRNTTARIIEVVFKSDSEQSLVIEASYLAAGASWLPVYRVDLLTGTEAVTLSRLASLKQETGENWEDIQLTVSNASGVTTEELPDLPIWRLQKAPSRRRSSRSARGDHGRRTGAGHEEDDLLLESSFESAVEEPSLVPADFVTPGVIERGIHFEYKLQEKIGVPGDGKDTLVPLLISSLPADLFHYTIPQQKTIVYRVCTIRPTGELLPGRLNIYSDGRYIGSSQVGEKRVGQDLQLNLGVDQRVRCVYEELVNRKSETLFGKVDRTSVAREFSYRICLENISDKSLKVRMVANVPVSDTDRYQVRGVAMTPKASDENWMGREGVMGWWVDLPPGDKEIQINFSVKYPQDDMPEGLS